MSIFTTNEIEYLGSGLLGRLATVEARTGSRTSHRSE